MLPWDIMGMRGRERMTTFGWMSQASGGFVLEMLGKFIQMVACR